jgi:hypothetical protein
MSRFVDRVLIPFILFVLSVGIVILCVGIVISTIGVYKTWPR